MVYYQSDKKATTKYSSVIEKRNDKNKTRWFVNIGRILYAVYICFVCLWL